MEADIKLEPDDWLAYYDHVKTDIHKSGNNRVWPYQGVLILLAAIFAWTSSSQYSFGNFFIAAWFGMLAFLITGIALYMPRWSERLIKRSVLNTLNISRSFNEPKCVVLTEGCIEVAGETEQTRYPWNSIQHVDTTSTHAFLVTAESGTVILPKRCFDSEKHFLDFILYAAEHVYRAKDVSVPGEGI